MSDIRDIITASKTSSLSLSPFSTVRLLSLFNQDRSFSLNPKSLGDAAPGVKSARCGWFGPNTRKHTVSLAGCPLSPPLPPPLIVALSLRLSAPPENPWCSSSRYGSLEPKPKIRFPLSQIRPLRPPHFWTVGFGSAHNPDHSISLCSLNGPNVSEGRCSRHQIEPPWLIGLLISTEAHVLEDHSKLNMFSSTPIKIFF